MGRRSKTAFVLAQEGGHAEVAASLSGRNQRELTMLHCIVPLK